jgi:hypothetical protein
MLVRVASRSVASIHSLIPTEGPGYQLFLKFIFATRPCRIDVADSVARRSSGSRIDVASLTASISRARSVSTTLSSRSILQSRNISTHSSRTRVPNITHSLANLPRRDLLRRVRSQQIGQRSSRIDGAPANGRSRPVAGWLARSRAAMPSARSVRGDEPSPHFEGMMTGLDQPRRPED